MSQAYTTVIAHLACTLNESKQQSNAMNCYAAVAAAFEAEANSRSCWNGEVPGGAEAGRDELFWLNLKM